MGQTWKDSINRQREALTHILRDPLEQITSDCIPLWGQCDAIENLLLISFSRIPYCAGLYALNTSGRQISSCISYKGAIADTYGHDRSQRPYLKDVVPAWGFLLSDVYISHLEQSPTITAVQVVRSGNQVLGFIGADFDLRDLPVTSELYIESAKWRRYQFAKPAAEPTERSAYDRSQMDRTLDTSLIMLEHLITERGVFQCEILFSGSMATIWQINDPYNYQLLDNKMLTDSKTLNDYPVQKYPENAEIPRSAVPDIIERLRQLRQGKKLVFLRSASINLFNGKIGLGFTGNSLYFPHYSDFLIKKSGFWISSAASDNLHISI